MIDEEALAGLLADHAERIPVPESAIDSLLAASPARARPSATHRSSFMTSRVLVVAATVVIALGAVWAYTARSDNRPASVRTRAGGEAALPRRASVTTSPFAADAERNPRPVPERATLRAASVTSGSKVQKSTGVAGLDVTNSAGAPTDPPTVTFVRAATLDLRVAHDGLGETIGRITTIAASADGFVADAHTAAPGTTPAGTVTIRVPTARFAATIERLRRLGTVTGAGVRSVDVGGRYAQLRGPVLEPDDQLRTRRSRSRSEPDP